MYAYVAHPLCALCPRNVRWGLMKKLIIGYVYLLLITSKHFPPCELLSPFQIIVHFSFVLSQTAKFLGKHINICSTKQMHYQDIFHGGLMKLIGRCNLVKIRDVWLMAKLKWTRIWNEGGMSLQHDIVCFPDREQEKRNSCHSFARGQKLP